MTNLSRAYELENGLKLGEEGPYVTGGSSTPVGLDLPELTIYIQNIADGNIIWRKFGTGVNDWRKLSHQDVSALNALDENLLVETNRSLMFTDFIDASSFSIEVESDGILEIS
jgi:hypothetical protein